jgi:hypothetical protein
MSDRVSRCVLVCEALQICFHRSITNGIYRETRRYDILQKTWSRKVIRLFSGTIEKYDSASELPR